MICSGDGGGNIVTVLPLFGAKLKDAHNHVLPPIFQGSLHLVRRDIIPQTIPQREGNTKSKDINT
jgi:hypothetical protein